MIKFLVPASLLIFLLSCKDNKNSVANNKQDTIQISAPIQELNKVLPIFTKQDSLELHAVGRFYFGKLRSAELHLLRIDSYEFGTILPTESSYIFKLSEAKALPGKFGLALEGMYELTIERANLIVKDISDIISVKYGNSKIINDTLVWDTKYKNIFLSIERGERIYVVLVVENVELKNSEKAKSSQENEKRLKSESSKF